MAIIRLFLVSIPVATIAFITMSGNDREFWSGFVEAWVRLAVTFRLPHIPTHRISTGSTYESLGFAFGIASEIIVAVGIALTVAAAWIEVRNARSTTNGR